MNIIYLAGPLFSVAERDFLYSLAKKLERQGHTVFWPGTLFNAEEIGELGAQGPSVIFSACRQALDGCGRVVAWLDGTQVDDGTAWEIGYAYAKGKPVYGLRTDDRRAGETDHSRVNSMIQGCLDGLAGSVEELAGMLAGGEGG